MTNFLAKIEKNKENVPKNAKKHYESKIKEKTSIQT